MSAAAFTPDDAAWTQRICRWASDVGMRLREDRSSGGISFTWQIPNNGTLHCAGSTDRVEALMRACVGLSRHVGTIHAAACPRFFL